MTSVARREHPYRQARGCADVGRSRGSGRSEAGCSSASRGADARLAVPAGPQALPPRTRGGRTWVADACFVSGRTNAFGVTVRGGRTSTHG